MNTRLAITATGIVLACAGCNLLPTSGANDGTAQVTVTYQDGSGIQQPEVSVGSVRCEFADGRGGFLPLKTDSGQVVLGTASEGSTLSLSMSLGHDALGFHATESVEANEDGAELANLQGEVLRTGDGDPAMVDPAATMTGTIACP